ncbi:MAG: radical SAM protein [Calditrichaeota bacterium]|nr:radical SAM protein [Calditrichota bacterium]
MVYGLKSIKLRIRLIWRILQIGFRAYGNPVIALQALIKTGKMRNQVQGNQFIPRFLESNNLHYWSPFCPGFPSVAFDNFIENELHRSISFRSSAPRLMTIIFSITSRCPLQCKHCFEWDNLNTPEPMTLDDLKLTLKKFQAFGVDQVQISGGEPTVRFDDMIELVETSEPETNFMLLTSGYNLTRENAERIKKAGFVGVNISLDHWIPELHNDMRGSEQAFDWAMDAAKNTRAVDLMLYFSLCATRSFVTEENIWKYLELTSSLGAGFIQILEPRAVGNFKDKQVDLSENQYKILEKFFLTVNNDRQYQEMPIVVFHGYHQRKMGCFGAGERYLFVDANCDIHACPFCQEKYGNGLVDSIPESIERIKSSGCQKFAKAVVDI